MKHGTSSFPPVNVYTSPSGIDPRYSAVGMFGRASYFAERAFYSHNGYTHTPPGQSDRRQMFIARVTAGKVERRTSDSKIVEPTRGFDSIRGLVRTDCFAYMVYETKLSYPAYLITYKA